MQSRATGIYQISHCDKPGFYYIGSTTQGFKLRWRSHTTSLLAGTHSSSFMQNIVNKYGLSGLSMRILEEVKLQVTDMRELEQEYINDFVESFGRYRLINTCLTTRCTTDDPVIKERQRISARRNGQSKTNLDRINQYNSDPDLKEQRVLALKESKCIKVLCVETNEEFESIAMASSKMVASGLSKAVNPADASKSIRNACKDESRVGYGFHWKFV